MIARLLDRLAGPAPRLGVDVAIIAGFLVTARIVHLVIQLLGELYG